MSRSGFLLAEDEAIKERFTGLTVSDDRNASRAVQVFFRYPEGETERFYPFITIELIDVVYSRNRQHSVVNQYAYKEGDAWATSPAALTYWPSVSSTLTVPANHKYSRTTEFVPVDILYQVSTFTRSALHDRQLTAKLLYDVVPFRYNSIHIPADKIYTLQMTAELPSSDFVGIKQATQINTTIIPSSEPF